MKHRAVLAALGVGVLAGLLGGSTLATAAGPRQPPVKVFAAFTVGSTSVGCPANQFKLVLTKTWGKNPLTLEESCSGFNADSNAYVLTSFVRGLKDATAIRITQDPQAIVKGELVEPTVVGLYRCNFLPNAQLTCWSADGALRDGPFIIESFNL